MRSLATNWAGRIFAVVVLSGLFGGGRDARAGQVRINIMADKDSGSGDAYDGEWVFDVSLNAAKDTVTMTVVSGNNARNTALYGGVSYSYPVTGVDMPETGDYSFAGTSLSTPMRGRYNLGVSGYYTPSTGGLVLNNPITSQLTRADGTPIGQVYKFTFSNIRVVPEPSTFLSALAAASLIGTGRIMKRRTGRRSAAAVQPGS